jgi:iron complex outermembrane receptor protein
MQTVRSQRRGHPRRSRIAEAVHLVLAGALAATSAAAYAATPAMPASAAASPGPISTAGLNAVLVTARRERHKKSFASASTIKTLDQDQIRASSRVGGVAQAMMLVPGVSVSSYGATGSSKTTISINGIKIGWAGFSGGNPDNGSVAPSFDGVPMMNPGNDLWQATLIPQTSILQTINVTYGPGEPKDRWWTNIGGALDFVPLQPSHDFGGEVALTYGSYQTRNLSFDLQTGDLGGWRTVIAGGYDKANDFLQGSDGYKNPSYNYAYYAKTRHDFSGGDGDFSIGAYVSRASAQRPFPIPVSPLPGVYLAGPGNGGVLQSQQTTGFYTTLPYSVNWKLDTNAIEMLWSKVNVDLSDVTSVHNVIYFYHEHRLHYTPLHDYLPPQVSTWEVNKPSAHVLGDKLTFELKLPYNDVFAGGYLQGSQYYSQEQTFNPYQTFAQAGDIGPPPPPSVLGSPTTANGQYDSDIFDQLNSALYLQDTINPIPSLRLTPGLRAVYYSVNFHPNEGALWPLAVQYNPCGDLSQINPPDECNNGAYVPGEAANPSPTAQKGFYRTEPSIGANWRALPWLAFYGSWGQTYRYPEMGGGTGPFVVMPADQVHLEKGTDTIVGLKVREPRLGPLTDAALDVSYSHLDFSHETIPTALASGGALLAFASSTYDGVNIFGDASPVHDFYVFANVGIVSAKFKNYINGNTDANGNLLVYHDVPISYTPTSNMSFGAYYLWHLDGVLIQPRLTYIRTGSQYAFDNANNIAAAGAFDAVNYPAPQPSYSSGGNVDIPAYGVLNFSTSFDFPTSWTDGVQDLKATIEVDNLANKKYNSFEYITSGGLFGDGNYGISSAGAALAFPGAPRTWYLTLSADF